MGDLSPNFSRQEFACHCCGKLPPDWLPGETPPLVNALEQLRAAAGNQGVIIVSGFRCVRHNRAVGGEPDSQHLIGKAADIHLNGHTLPQTYEVAQAIPPFVEGGIGYYPEQHFVHLDVRGHEARWGWLNGRYVSIAAALREQA
ncbi:MAG: YcbK family protein [Desulfobaccales bacterium]